MLPILTREGARDACATAASINEAEKLFKEMLLAIAFAKDRLKAASPSPESSDMMVIPDIMTGVSNAEYKWAEALKALNIPSVIGREVEERHAALRKANESIRELTKQIGEAVGPTHIQAGIQRATKIVNAWWKSCGFAYVSSVTFREYNCEITASLLQPETRSLEKDNNDDRSIAEIWAKQMADRGWQTVSEDGGRDRYIIDNDINASLLKEIVKNRFSEAHISERKATSVYGKDVMMVREIRFSVSLDSIFNGVSVSADIED